MRFFKKIAKLSARELKELAVLIAAATLLVGAAVLLSGDIPEGLRPMLGFLAPQSSVATPFGVIQGIPEYNAPTPYKGGYPSPLSCGFGGADCGSPYVKTAALSVYPVGSLQGQTVLTNHGGATTSIVGSTPTLFTPGQVRIEWSCQPSQYAQRTCSYIYDCGDWWRSGTCAAYYDCSENNTYANTSTATNFTTGGALIGTTTVTFPTGPTSRTYTLQCKNGGSTWSASVTVMLTSATLSLTADPDQVVSGGMSQLTWATTGTVANSCSIVDSKGVVGERGLGSDTSGQGNPWVLNNLSSFDQVAQSPTSEYAVLARDYYVSDYSKGVVRAGVALNGNYGAAATWQMNSGKWYWEHTLRSGVQSGYPIVGIWGDTSSGYGTRAYPGHNQDSGIGYSASRGYFTQAGANLPVTGPTAIAGDVIGVAYDADTGKVYFSKNGVWMNSANPAAGTGYIGFVKGGSPGFASYYGKTYVNFGQGGSPSVIFSDSSNYNRGFSAVTGLPRVSNTRYKFGATSAFFSSGAIVTPDQ